MSIALCQPSRGVVLGSVLMSLLFGSVAVAQTGTPLLVKPWDKDQTFEGSADGIWMNSAHADKGAGSMQVSDYSTEGRFRLSPGDIASPRIGYQMTFLDTRTSGNKVVPRDLSDESIGFGTPILKWHDWVAGMTLGVGYAGDTAFARGGALYGKASIAAGKILNNGDILGVVLDYDGNRPYVQDLPLPGIEYSHRFDPTLSMVLGLPYTSIEWKPIDHLTLSGSYALLTDLTAKISYEVVKSVNIYTSYEIQRNAFHVDDLPADRRLLFESRRVEAGVHWDCAPYAGLFAAVGYSFDNRFLTGFDFQDTDKVTRISDTPYVRAGLDIHW